MTVIFPFDTAMLPLLTFILPIIVNVVGFEVASILRSSDPPRVREPVLYCKVFIDPVDTIEFPELPDVPADPELAYDKPDDPEVPALPALPEDPVEPEDPFSLLPPYVKWAYPVCADEK